MFNKKISNKDLLVLFNCLERYNGTGLGPQRAIIEFSNINNNIYINEVLEEVCNDLENGMFLSVALDKHKEVFPSYVVEMLKVGENTGDLASVYVEIINYLDEQIKIDTSMTSALMMPKVFGVLILFLLAGYVFWVLPRLTKQLAQMNTDVPFITQLLISFGQFSVDYWFLWIALGVILMFGFKYVKASHPLFFDHVKYKLPILGELYLLQLNYKFCKIMSICYSAGINLTRSLAITSNAVSSPCLKQSLDEVVQQIASSDFIVLLREKDQYKLLNPFLFPLLNAGLVSNSLGEVLADESQRCMRQINYAIKGVEEKIGNMVLIPIWGILIIVMVAIVMPFLSLIESTGSKIMGGGI
ncbi:hypothetical protein NZ47_05555 [Anaerovibrio lipolyticus]|uniref:Type II secretion system protein GspF domain-containing protein n=1 Tax=Anaerovibrio lipolyticus TaxID=82374 RepID=A0A0B2JVG8_9FIRM|nr:type II secretion system F family protein [Anaerovibrio lipolyticus]KHM52315.1 hypothetical protein NZ47_05555 [Anaerovibrio lipolyticus]